MKVPKERVQFATVVDGERTETGFLVIELKGIDLEGVNRLTIPMDIVLSAEQRGRDALATKDKLKNLLGG